MQQNSIEPLHKHCGTLKQKSDLSGLTGVDRDSLSIIITNKQQNIGVKQIKRAEILLKIYLNLKFTVCF